MENKDRDSNRRKFLRVSALAGIVGFLSGRLAEGEIIPPVQANDGQPLYIGLGNNAGTQTTTLTASVLGDVLLVENPVVTEDPESLNAAIRGYASGTSGGNVGVVGRSESPDGTGVRGRAVATTGKAIGVDGASYSPDGKGVRGLAFATSGNNIGVRGQSDSSSGMGVSGWASATSGDALGVHGLSDSSVGVGVVGNARATAGECIGVLGYTESTEGVGARGSAKATSGNTIGVEGYSCSPEGIAVRGHATATSGSNMGVLGFSESPVGTGVRGECSGGIGVYAFSSAGKALRVDGVASFSTAGAGLIPAKSSSVDIADTRVTGSSHVTITFTDNPGKSISVQWIARKPGVGFTVNLTDKVARNTSFTYLIVEPS